MAHIALSPTACTAASSRPRGRVNFVMAALDAWRQRRQMERLDAHLLRDIGLDAEDVSHEAARPIWDVPGFWLR